jgi:coenzyme PQQ synthesis protein D (PqqD)
MKRSNGHSLPKARKADLVTRQIPGELLVYDLKRHKAFCLNDAAASVWKNCNGKRTVKDLALALEKDRQAPVDDKVIWLALDQLEKSNLLQATATRPAGFLPVSRRSLLRAGIITAVTLPLVTMITAPVAAQAATPITEAACKNRHGTDPGGCGGFPCSDKPGICKSGGGNNCQCA